MEIGKPNLRHLAIQVYDKKMNILLACVDVSFPFSRLEDQVQASKLTCLVLAKKGKMEGGAYFPHLHAAFFPCMLLQKMNAMEPIFLFNNVLNKFAHQEV